MNKEYVLTKLAEQYSSLEKGILEPNSPTVAGVGSAVLGGLFGGLIAGSYTTPYDAMRINKLEKEVYHAKLLKNIGIGALVGGAGLGILGYAATVDDNSRKKEDPEKYLYRTGRTLTH